MAPQCFFDRSIIIRHFIRPLVLGFIGLTLTTLTVSMGAMEFALAYEPMAVVNGGRGQGHGLAVDNPYYAVTGSEGMFDIRDLPAGTYRIKAWHPTLGVQDRELTVVAGESSSVEFTFKAK
jgi:hypothetical protein